MFRILHIIHQNILRLENNALSVRNMDTPVSLDQMFYMGNSSAMFTNALWRVNIPILCLWCWRNESYGGDHDVWRLIGLTIGLWRYTHKIWKLWLKAIFGGLMCDLAWSKRQSKRNFLQPSWEFLPHYNMAFFFVYLFFPIFGSCHVSLILCAIL